MNGIWMEWMFYLWNLWTEKTDIVSIYLFTDRYIHPDLCQLRSILCDIYYM
jgi:hypothetical protein